MRALIDVDLDASAPANSVIFRKLANSVDKMGEGVAARRGPSSGVCGHGAFTDWLRPPPQDGWRDNFAPARGVR